LEGDVRIGSQSLDLPWTVWVHSVSEELFDVWTDEDTKAELIDGEMIVHSPASLQHEDVVSFLGGLMSFYADAQALGKVIASGNGVVHLASGRKFAPDIFFIRQARIPAPLPREFEGAPDLLVEVLSSSTRSIGLQVKRFAYRDAGVVEIWFIDREQRQVLIDRKHNDGYREDTVTDGLVTSDVLPGYWIHTAWLWAEPLPNRLDCLQEILQR
jgi:Uma2 family endonuclease